jgi:hypothetical protein
MGYPINPKDALNQEELEKVKRGFVIVGLIFFLTCLLFCTSCIDQFGAPMGSDDRTFQGIPPGGPPPVELSDGTP